MKELKFNADMIQAIKEGRKTQTRRPFKHPCKIYRDRNQQAIRIEEQDDWYGDRNYCIRADGGSWMDLTKDDFVNRYSKYKIGDTHDIDGTKIKITDIRVERLQDISEEDAIAEGLKEEWVHGYDDSDCIYGIDENDIPWLDDPVEMFERHIWNKLPYKPPYDWNSNPFVWVIEFEKAESE